MHAEEKSRKKKRKHQKEPNNPAKKLEVSHAKFKEDSVQARNEKEEDEANGSGINKTVDDQGITPTNAKKSEDFDSWYLRHITLELQDDLDKVRSAQDFRDGSLQVLISALKQGADLFSEEEKRQIMATNSGV